VKDGEGENLFDDVSDMNGGRWSAAILDLTAELPDVLRFYLRQKPVLESRKDVPFKDGFAH
jgi:hypothetical protein